MFNTQSRVLQADLLILESMRRQLWALTCPVNSDHQWVAIISMQALTDETIDKSQDSSNYISYFYIKNDHNRAAKLQMYHKYWINGRICLYLLTQWNIILRRLNKHIHCSQYWMCRCQPMMNSSGYKHSPNHHSGRGLIATTPITAEYDTGFSSW